MLYEKFIFIIHRIKRSAAIIGEKKILFHLSNPPPPSSPFSFDLLTIMRNFGRATIFFARKFIVLNVIHITMAEWTINNDYIN